MYSQIPANLFATKVRHRYVAAMTARSHAKQTRAHSPPSKTDSKRPWMSVDGEFGNYLYRQRQICGFSQAALAQSAAISAGYLSELENGKRRPPTQRVVNQLATALGLRALEREKLRCLAAAERALLLAGPLHPKLAALIQALHAAAPSLPEQTIDKLINTLEEAEM